MSDNNDQPRNRSVFDSDEQKQPDGNSEGKKKSFDNDRSELDRDGGLDSPEASGRRSYNDEQSRDSSGASGRRSHTDDESTYSPEAGSKRLASDSIPMDSSGAIGERSIGRQLDYEPGVRQESTERNDGLSRHSYRHLDSRYSDRGPTDARGSWDTRLYPDGRQIDSNRTSDRQSDSDDKPMNSLGTGSGRGYSHSPGDNSRQPDSDDKPMNSLETGSGRGYSHSRGDNSGQSDSDGLTESQGASSGQANTDRSDQQGLDSYPPRNVKYITSSKKSDSEGSDTGGNKASGGLDSGRRSIDRSPTTTRDVPMDIDDENYTRERKFSTKYHPGKDTGKEPVIERGVHLNELLWVSKADYRRFYRSAGEVTYDMRRQDTLKRKVDCLADQFKVKLPHMAPSGGKGPSWNDICPKLKCLSVRRAYDVQDIIHSYNKSRPWSFSGLIRFLEMKSKSMNIWHVLEKMGGRAANLSKLFRVPLPLLRKGKSASLTLSRAQIACLLCNAFFCTFPMRENESSSHHGFFSRRLKGTSVDAPPVPTINFFGLFQDQHGREKSVEGKLNCLFNYFDRITRGKDPEGCVTFERLVCKGNEYPDWSTSRKHFTNLHVRRDGFIEDEGKGMLQVDFANKLVGGGVLGRGCVQEEIRFVICPELIVSRLFTEELEEDETLLITGCERFSNFEGYGRSFSFAGNCVDDTDCDDDGRRLTQVIAMDALSYKEHRDQFHPRCIDRELRKAYCGFHSPRWNTERRSAVATGNWGCGAFRGDRHLKALIQLMAAAEAGRDVLYITIDDGKLVEDLWKVHSFIRDKNLTVGNVFKMIRFYSDNAYRRKYRDIKPLFDYILDVYDNKVPVSGSRAENTEV